MVVSTGSLVVWSSVLYISCMVVWIADGWCVFVPVVKITFHILYLLF